MKKNLLDKRVAECGVSYQFLSNKLGITRQALYKKRNGESEFTGREIVELCKILNIEDLDEVKKIFCL